MRKLIDWAVPFYIYKRMTVQQFNDNVQYMHLGSRGHTDPEVPDDTYFEPPTREKVWLGGQWKHVDRQIVWWKNRPFKGSFKMGVCGSNTATHVYLYTHYDAGTFQMRLKDFLAAICNGKLNGDRLEGDFAFLRYGSSTFLAEVNS